MKVKYVGTSHYRVLDASDATRAEPSVKGFKKTTWARGEVIDVSDAAGEWLTGALAEEFVQVTEPDQKTAAQPTDSSPNAAPADKSSKTAS